MLLEQMRDDKLKWFTVPRLATAHADIRWGALDKRDATDTACCQKRP